MHGTGKINAGMGFFLVSLFLFSFVIAANEPSVPPGTWKGYVFNETAVSNNSYLTPNGLPVSVFVNGAASATYNVSIGYGGFAGYYIVDVAGDGVSDVTFKVCGVNATQGAQAFASGPHPTGASPYYNLTWNRSADSAACTYACGCSGGYCNSGVCASSATTTTTTSGGGGGGGGGGATTTLATTTTTVTTTTTTTTIREQVTVAQITPTAPAIITPTQAGLAIEQISIEVKNTVSNVQITVTQTSAPPSAAASAPVAISSSSGSVYKYIEINKANIQDADIVKTKIKFKVENAWINSENINSATIAMSKLVNNAWTKLQTTKLSEDSNYIYFESELSSLSVFAVTGEKAIVTTTTTVKPPATTIPATTTTLPTTKPISGEWIVLAVAIIVIAAAAVHLFERKKSVWPWQK